MDKNRKCPVCGGEFEDGVSVDSGSFGTFALQQQQWAKKITLGGLHADDSKGITTYRCKSCGFLESYAK